MERTTRITSLAAALFLVLFTYGQPAIQWQKCLGGSYADEGYAIEQTSDGGYILAGYAMSHDDGDVSGWHGWSDAWVVKLDGSGNLQWQKCLGGTGRDIAEAIQQTSDGGYIMAGYTHSDDGDVSGWHTGYNEWGAELDDAWVVKLNGNGTIQWQKCLGGTAEDRADAIQQTGDGGYILAGYTKSNDGDVSGNNGDRDAWVVKLDGSGNLQWQKCLGGTGYDDAYSIQSTDDGYIMAGYTESNEGVVVGNNGAGDAWVVKLDGSGNFQWQKCLGGTGDDEAYTIQQTNEGGYIMAGGTISNDGNVSGNQGNHDAWVVKLDGNGTLQWQKCYGGTDNDGATAIQIIDEGYIMAGITASNDGDVFGNNGTFDAWVVKLDGSSNLQWQKSLGGTEGDIAYAIQQTADGGYIMAGITESDDGDVSGYHGGGDYMYDVWVVKLGPDGSVSIPATSPARFSMAPNPTNGILAITFAQHAQARYLMLLDATGRVVLEHSIANISGPVAFDLSGHENGLYLVQVRFADGTQAVQRVMKE